MVERSPFSFLDNFDLWVGHDIDRGIYLHTLDCALPKRILGDRRKEMSKIEGGELLLKDGYIKNECIPQKNTPPSFFLVHIYSPLKKKCFSMYAGHYPLP